MSSVTQRVPNILRGISQQPDNRKFPGQVRDAVNAYPDYALGLLKRPGGRLVSELPNAKPGGRWFNILRDVNEKYVGQFNENIFRIWSLTDGTPRVVTYESTSQVDTYTITGTPTQDDQITLTINTDEHANNYVVTSASETLDDVLTGILSNSSATNEYTFTTTSNSTEVTLTITKNTVGYAFDSSITVTNSTTTTQLVITKTSTSPSYVIPAACDYDAQSTNLTAYRNAAAATKTALTALQTAEKEYIDILASTKETETPLFETTQNNQYSIGQDDYTNYQERETLTSGALLNKEGTYTVKDNDVVVATTTSLPFPAVPGPTDTVYDLGSERTEEHPNLASQGYRVFQVIKTEPAEFELTDSEVVDTTNTYNTAKTTYNTAVSAESTALTNLTTEQTNCNISALPTGHYLEGADPKDIEFLTVNDYTYVLNKQKTVAMKPTLSSGANQSYGFVVVNTVAYSTQYVIYADGNIIADVTTIPSTNTATLNMRTLLVELRVALAASTAVVASASMIGNGILIVFNSPTAPTLSVTGGTGSNSMTCFTNEVSSIAELPKQCRNGYVVKIVNSETVDVDDQYVEFSSNDDGAGVWVERNKPGIQYQLDEDTMPHRLVRNADSTFTFGPVTDWADRLVGDDNTNPLPLFIGAKIKSMFVYRDRFGLLSDDTVSLSKAGDFYNYFATTATTATDDDPITISAAGTRPVTLNHAQTTNIGLILFGVNDQFVLSTDNDVFSPTTAKLNKLSSFETDSEVTPLSIGTSLGFITKTPLHTQYLELLNISDQTPPSSRETSQIVPELLPRSIDSMVASPSLSMVSFATKGSGKVYQYKFLESGENRVIETWYRWELSGSLLDQFFDGSAYYAVLSNDDANPRVYVQSFETNQANEQGFLQLNTGERTDVCLDSWSNSIGVSYTAETTQDPERTTLTLPFYPPPSATVAVVNTDDGNVYYPTLTDNTCDIQEDLRGKNLVAGVVFKMSVELPTIYPTQQSSGNNVSSDDNSNLIVHRMKFSTGLSGPVDYKVSITGLDDWDNTVAVTLPYEYELGEVNMLPSSTHTLPIYQRNENLKVRIEGSSPFPISMLGYSWEGRYTNKFYQRV